MIDIGCTFTQFCKISKRTSVLVQKQTDFAILSAYLANHVSTIIGYIKILNNQYNSLLIYLS